MILWIAGALGVFVGLVSAIGMIGFALALLASLLHSLSRADAQLEPPRTV